MDKELRIQLLRALVTDRLFLRKAAADISADYFPDRHEALVADLAIRFWDRYTDTLGPMLQSEASAAAAKKKFSEEQRKKLRELIGVLQGTRQELVSVQALIDRVRGLRTERFWDDAVEEILEAKEKDALTPEKLADLFDRAGREIGGLDFTSHDVLTSLEQRIERRARPKKYPAIMIDELDRRIKMIGRGHLGMLLAPPASGKGQGLIHIALAYALQGLNVMLVELEDSPEEVEDRFDSALTGLPKTRLAALPNKLRRRFRRAMKQIRGRIRVIDGTEGGWSIPQVEKAWHHLKREDFTADVVIVDYDDELVSDQKFTGDSARRMEFAHIYRSMRQTATRLDVIFWTAAQTGKAADGVKIVLGKHAAEDFSKIRKSTLCISIGQCEEDPNRKHLHVVRHKLDRSKFGVDIMSDFSRSIFYDREATEEMKIADRHS